MKYLGLMICNIDNKLDIVGCLLLDFRLLEEVLGQAVGLVLGCQHHRALQEVCPGTTVAFELKFNEHH